MNEFWILFVTVVDYFVEPPFVKVVASFRAVWIPLNISLLFKVHKVEAESRTNHERGTAWAKGPLSISDILHRIPTC